MTDYFEKKAKTWDESPRRTQMSDAFFTEISKNITLDKSVNVLEFGCGTGTLGTALAPLINSITMVDTSPAMLEVLEQKIKHFSISNMTIHRGDISAYSNENHFDLVVSLMAFHHVTDIPAVLHAFKNLLKGDGRVIIGDLTSEDGSFHADTTVPHNGFEIDHLNGLLSENGFKVEISYIFNTVTKADAAGKPHEYRQFLTMASVQK